MNPLEYDGHTYHLELDRSSDPPLVRVDGEVVPLEIVEVTATRIVVRHKGRRQLIRVVQDKGEVRVGLEGHSLTFSPAGRRSSSATPTHGPVPSPITGKVIQVLVEEGQTVSAGDTLFLIEAMKMENAVLAPVDGVVRDVKAGEGQSVDQGSALCVIDPLSE